MKLLCATIIIIIVIVIIIIIVIIITDHLYKVLFSALEQTHRTYVACDSE